jgi:hypothetical protein
MTNTTVLVRYKKAYLYQKKVFLHINNKTFARIFIFNKTELLNYHCATLHGTVMRVGLDLRDPKILDLSSKDVRKNGGTS